MLHLKSPNTKEFFIYVDTLCALRVGQFSVDIKYNECEYRIYNTADDLHFKSE